MTDTRLQVFRSVGDLRQVLANEYRRQIEALLGDERKALEFLSGVVAAVQRTPELLKCEPATLINSFVIMAQLKFMPSAVSGEAYVLPYEKGKGSGIFEAQFQLGYQGIVTLLYRAGNRSVVAELVRQHDTFRIVNGSMYHEVDPMKTRDERGPAVGAYAIIETKTGGKVERFMRMDEITAHAQRFSKSYAAKFTPWDPANDPEGWMPRKTVLKQAAKLAPKNEQLVFAIAEDNKDSVIADRLDAAAKDSAKLRMGALLDAGTKTTDHDKESTTPPQSGSTPAAEGSTE